MFGVSRSAIRVTAGPLGIYRSEFCMKLVSRLVSALLLVGLAVSAARADEANVAVPAGQRVFTAGHSFHMPIATPLADICRLAGIDHKVAGTQSIGGSTVTQHWNLPDGKNKAKKALAAGEVDVLTLSPNVLMPDPAIDQFTALLLEHNPAGRVYVQVSWVPRDATLLPGFKNASRDKTAIDYLRNVTAPYADKVRDQVKAINSVYTEKLKRQVVFVVPVGQAVTTLREKVVKGEVPGISKQSELFRDDLGHGKELIGLLNAYCHFAAIYGKSPVGLPTPAVLQKANLGANTDKVNRLLQEIAWQEVTKEPLSGVTATP